MISLALTKNSLNTDQSCIDRITVQQSLCIKIIFRRVWEKKFTLFLAHSSSVHVSQRTNAYSLFSEWNIILSWPGNGSFHLLLGIVRPGSMWQLSAEIPISNKLWGMRANTGQMNLCYQRKYFSTAHFIQCQCDVWSCCIIVWPQRAIQFFRVEQIGILVFLVFSTANKCHHL